MTVAVGLAGGGQQRVRPVHAPAAVARQPSPARPSAGCQQRLSAQAAAPGSTPLPDGSHACRRGHPGEKAGASGAPSAAPQPRWTDPLPSAQAHWRRFVQQRAYRRRLQFLYMNWRAVVKVTAPSSFGNKSSRRSDQGGLFLPPDPDVREDVVSKEELPSSAGLLQRKRVFLSHTHTHTGGPLGMLAAEGNLPVGSQKVRRAV